MNFERILSGNFLPNLRSEYGGRLAQGTKIKTIRS